MDKTLEQQNLPTKLATLPRKPGVYIFRDEKKRVLYVGKAKILKNRVASYFQKQSSLEERKKIMVTEIADLETIITPTEADALLLEATLIKKEWPPYNVVMKDDKFFLYIRVTLSDQFPTVELVRNITNKKDVYFGPYTSAVSARETVKALKLIFKFRTCTPNQGKPCFDYTIGRCTGVCIGEITEKEYRVIINELILFLRGKGETVVNGLKKMMTTQSQQKKFERAARIRDRIMALEKIIKQQTVVSNRKEDSDILGIARDGRRATVAVLQIRSGKLIHKQTIQLTSAIEQSESDIIKAFIEQYYTEIPERPTIVYTEILPDNTTLIRQTLHMRVSRPQRGAKAVLALNAHENAVQALVSYLASFEKDERATLQSLKKIQTTFSLARIPNRIESFDVANISGKYAVGAMVVFVMGKPAKNLYKKFTIRTIKKPDDPRMLAEVIKRRIDRMKLLSAGWEKPDLIILDGGKGQLSVTQKILKSDRHLVPLVALAKGGHARPTQQSLRETFFLNDGRSLQLPSASRELYLLERIRDEAHRFATTFYRKKHLKSQSVSALDEIPGIGEKRKKDLLRHFGSVERIKKSNLQELTAIIGKKAAQTIQSALHDKN